MHRTSEIGSDLYAIVQALNPFYINEDGIDCECLINCVLELFNRPRLSLHLRVGLVYEIQLINTINEIINVEPVTSEFIF
jgi:hypothetical protein